MQETREMWVWFLGQEDPLEATETDVQSTGEIQKSPIYREENWEIK